MLGQFSGDELTRVEVDINRVLFNAVCVKKNQNEIPPEYDKIGGGLNPFNTEEGRHERAADSRKTLDFPDRNVDGNQSTPTSFWGLTLFESVLTSDTVREKLGQYGRKLKIDGPAEYWHPE